MKSTTVWDYKGTDIEFSLRPVIMWNAERDIDVIRCREKTWLVRSYSKSIGILELIIATIIRMIFNNNNKYDAIQSFNLVL